MADAMAKSGRVAIAELVSRGKEQLVLIRPYRNGLVLHSMYYGNEVRDFKQVPKGENVKVSETELDLGVGLIERLTSEEFKPENYNDEYRILGGGPGRPESDVPDRRGSTKLRCQFPSD